MGSQWVLPEEPSGYWNPVGIYPGPFYTAVFDVTGPGIDHIDSLTNEGQVIPEPGTMELSLLGIIGLLSLAALRPSRHSAAPRATP